MWLRAGGRSLWPLVLDGDQLQVERCGAEAIGPGDIALVAFPKGPLVAHLVRQTAPLVTVSIVGVVDPPSELLGRVVALRRKGVTVSLPRGTAAVLRWLPGVATRLKTVPGLKGLVRRLRDPP